MTTPRIVRSKKKWLKVLTELFNDFPQLNWFRNVHDMEVHFDWTVDYLALCTNPNSSRLLYQLTRYNNGPVLYCGRDLDGRLWAFASNSLANPDPGCGWMISVEQQDHFMVAVFNTILNRAGMLPLIKNDLFRSSMGLSNCEVPDKDIVEWLKIHESDMPEELVFSCDKAHLDRM